MSAIVADPVKISFLDLAKLSRAAKGQISHVYLHWTGGHYKHVYDDYHLSIGKNGELYLPCSDFREDAFLIRRSHTYQRNSWALGIALCCGYRAGINGCGEIDYGPEPPTSLQIEALARVLAYIAHYLELYINPNVMRTHYEVAVQDGYGPGSLDPDMRWDLWLLEDLPFRKGLHPGGEVLRGKASYYLEREFGQRKGVQAGWQSTKPLLNAA